MSGSRVGYTCALLLQITQRIVPFFYLVYSYSSSCSELSYVKRGGYLSVSAVSGTGRDREEGRILRIIIIIIITWGE